MQLDSKWSLEQEVGFDFISILQIVFPLANLVKWNGRLSTFDRLAEIGEVDVVHALSSRQSGKIQNAGIIWDKGKILKISPASWIADEKSAQQVAASTR